MYAYISELLSDKKDGAIFSCLGIWHFCYILGFLFIVTILIVHLRQRDRQSQQKGISFFINAAFCLYIADLFLMPFAYGKIDVEKLPFHICTAMCVMCFWSRHNQFLARFRQHFALLGFISNLIYFFYPAGLMWYQIHPLSYRVLQTLLFHACMATYGLLFLIFEDIKYDNSARRKDFAVIVAMTLWALLGNALYTGHAWGQTNNFNWFFVTQDPFSMFPPHIARYVMPPLNILLFYSIDMLVYFILRITRRTRASS